MGDQSAAECGWLFKGRIVLVELAAMEGDEDEDEEKEATDAVKLVWDLDKDDVIFRIPCEQATDEEKSSLEKVLASKLKEVEKELTGKKQASLPINAASVVSTPSDEKSSLNAACDGRALRLVEQSSGNLVLEAAGLRTA